MLYFDTRKLAREFARKQSHYKLVDLQGNSDRRWAVRVLKKK